MGAGVYYPRFCDADDVPLVLRMSAIINELFDTFDYSKSPEFLRSLNGKTAEFRAMKLRLITPRPAGRIMLKRFGDALVRVRESDAVFELLESTRHERIKELRALLSEVLHEDVVPITNSPNRVPGSS
jgi:hypothetical protein